MRRCTAVLAMLRAAAAIVPRTRWQPQAERHLARVTKLLGAAPDVAAAQSKDNPLLNFVFTYYGSDLGAAANLGRWCPPVGVAIEASQDDRERLWRGIESSGAYDPRKLPKKRLAALERGRAALARENAVDVREDAARHAVHHMRDYVPRLGRNHRAAAAAAAADGRGHLALGLAVSHLVHGAHRALLVEPQLRWLIALLRHGPLVPARRAQQAAWVRPA